MWLGGFSLTCRAQVLTNLVLLCAFAFLYGLQRLLFGRLRPIEVEQLYEKAWFAVTETCLAMTIFRDEVGGWFLVMFVSLLFGKVWGWISEGRVDFLEQQPPSDPRLFHARLSTSLLLSITFDMLMLDYCLETVYVEARPGMMVMFAFEFAVLLICSVSTSLRYAISLMEAYVVRKQTQERLQVRRAEIRAANEAIQRNEGAEAGTTEENNVPVQRPEDITEEDIEAPGWEDKGRWIFFLDLATDFCKLVVYLAFFIILTLFHGLPIHIFRDVWMTANSFTKRILDFIKYRQATKDMNERYPDATEEELRRESTCIICREDMRSWQAENNPPPPAQEQAPGVARPPRFTDERLRPKKLPCGHVLHLGCLRSWLERQQVCPTCRRSVLVTAPRPPTGAPANANQQGQNANQNPREQIQNRMRRINLGPLNFQFGVFQDDQWQNMLRQLDRRQQPQAPPQGQSGVPQNSNSSSGSSPSSIQTQLRSVEQQIMQEIQGLNITHQQLSTVLALQGELARLRIAHSRLQSGNASSDPTQPAPHQINQYTQGAVQPAFNQVSTWTASQPQQATIMGPSHPDLPPGLVLPQGWNAMPLRRLGRSQPTMSNSTPASLNPNANLGNQAAPESSSNNLPQIASRNTLADQTNRPSTTAQDSAVPSVQPSAATVDSQSENGGSSNNAESVAAAAESPPNKTPWASSSWGFGDASSGSNAGNTASSSNATQAKPATVEDVPDGEAGPSNTFNS